MTNDSVGVKRWLLWTLTLFVLGSITFYLAFRTKVRTAWAVVKK